MDTLSEKDAWEDFYDYIRSSETWDTLTLNERNRLSLANTDSKEKRIGRDGRPLRLGFSRLKSLLETYAPGRYRFEMIERIYRA